MHFITNLYGGKENFDSTIVSGIYSTGYNLIGEYNKKTGELKKYKIKNPDEKSADVYVATKNGSYTFTVEINGKKYTKTVNINNIEGETALNYTVEIVNGDIVLVDMDTKEYTTFENAYVIENENVIDITNMIESDNSRYEINYIDTDKLSEQGIIGTEIILKKDNVYYYKKIVTTAVGPH